MDTMTSISTYANRQLAADNLDNQGRRRNSDYTTGADRVSNGARPLREVAREQAAVLRTVGSTGARSAARADMQARVDAVRAEQNAPAPTARPTVAAVGDITFKMIDDLAKTIPTGFYALPKREDATNASQPTYHFKIHKFRGGHRIVMVTGGVGAFVEIPMKKGWQWAALQKIAADPKAAAILFGQETGTCGRCNSPLTNATSRAYGLGPDCRKAY